MTRPTPKELDVVLTAQIAVAWAGESGEKGDSDGRLGWWETNLHYEFGGKAFFEELLPKTGAWALLQTLREAARRTDAQARAEAGDPDKLLSLYHFGYERDLALGERLATLKRSGESPQDALPSLVLLDQGWDPARFADWLDDQPGGPSSVRTTASPVGRRLVGSPPETLTETSARLCAALNPLEPRAYPLPHYKLS